MCFAFPACLLDTIIFFQYILVLADLYFILGILSYLRLLLFGHFFGETKSHILYFILPMQSRIGNEKLKIHLMQFNVLKVDVIYSLKIIDKAIKAV